MKKLAAIVLLSVSSFSFACDKLIGDFQCIDKYSYSYYINISIKEVDLVNGKKGLLVEENGHKRYNTTLKVDGKKYNSENTKIRSTCDNNVLEVTMSMGRYSDTDTYALTKSGLTFTTKEENGNKRLKCKRI